MDEKEEKRDPIAEKISALPKDVRDAIFSVGVGKKISEISQKYKLHIDKAEEFSAETGKVMIGLTPPKDYLGNLKGKLELPEDMAAALVADVNEQIFKPIRDSLKKIHQIKESGEEQSVSSVYSSVSQPATQPVHQNIAEQNLGGQVSSLGTEDKKILSDSGIEIENNPRPMIDDPQGIQEAEHITTPNKEDLLSALENPESIQKNGTSVPAGFTLSKNPPTIPSATQTPAPIQQKQPEQTSKETKVDPYREPVS